MSARWSQSLLGPFLLKSNDKNYLPLRNSEQTEEELKTSVTREKKRGFSSIHVALLLLVFSTLSGAGGFTLGNLIWKVSKHKNQGV